MAMEQRFCKTELRVDPEGRIEGYAAVFNTLSLDLGGFREKVQLGAFRKTLTEADVRGLFNHDPHFVLGRNKAGTLELAEDSMGLHFRATPPAATWAADLRLSIERGDIDQGSFSFDTIRDEWTNGPEGRERELIEVRLYDVSVVTYPAYPQTSVAVRSMIPVLLAQAGDDPELRAELVGHLQRLTAPVEDDHPVAVRSVERMRRLLELAGV